jgi:hypothetical protein
MNLSIFKKKKKNDKIKMFKFSILILKIYKNYIINIQREILIFFFMNS